MSGLGAEVKDLERRLELTRERVREHEDRRERFQTDVNRLHREHVDRRAELDSAQARTDDAARRMAQLETGLADVRAELARTETELRASRGRMEAAIDALAALEPQRVELEQERERMRAEAGAARAAATAAQQRARELAVQVESRRSSHTSLTTTLGAHGEAAGGLAAAAQYARGSSRRAKRRSPAAQAQLEARCGCARKSRPSCGPPGSPAMSWTRLLRERDAAPARGRAAGGGGARQPG